MTIMVMTRPPPIMRDLKELEGLPPREKGETLSDLERLGILYGIYWRMSPGRIHKHYGMSAGSISRFKRGIYDNPLSVFRLHVVRRARNGTFQCRLCGEPRDKQDQIERHLLTHFFPHELAKTIDLSDLPEVL